MHLVDKCGAYMHEEIDIKSNIIELKFSGNDINPTKLSPKEVANILTKFEEALRPILETENPEVDFGDNYVGIHEIKSGSISFRYIVKEHLGLIKAGLTTLVLSIQNNTIDDLPLKSIDAIKKISTFKHRWNCSAYIGYYEPSNKKFTELIKFEGYKKASFKSLKVPKTLYGRLVKLGDDENPKAHIRLINGQIIGSAIATKDVIKFRKYLWENVKISGEATISGQTLKIIAFKIDSMSPYSLMSVDETVASLKNILS